MDIKYNNVDSLDKLIKFAEKNNCIFYQMENDTLYFDIPKDLNKETLRIIQNNAYNLNLGLKLNRI